MSFSIRRWTSSLAATATGITLHYRSSSLFLHSLTLCFFSTSIRIARKGELIQIKKKKKMVHTALTRKCYQRDSRQRLGARPNGYLQLLGAHHICDWITPSFQLGLSVSSNVHTTAVNNSYLTATSLARWGSDLRRNLAQLTATATRMHRSFFFLTLAPYFFFFFFFFHYVCSRIEFTMIAVQL